MMLVAVVALSLALRLAFAPFTPFGADESYLADRFADMAAWPTSGGIVAYDGSLRLGTLLTWLAGVPIKLAGGSPVGGMVALALYGFVEALLVVRIFERLFPRTSRVRIWALILLAPWTLVFQSLFHASFTPLFGLLFFWAMLRLFEDGGDFKAWMAIPISFLGCFQIGLYFAPLVLVLAFCIGSGMVSVRGKRARALKGCALGVALICIPLFAGRLMPSELPHYPFHLDHPAYAATASVPHPYVIKEVAGLQRTTAQARQGLVGFDPARLLQLPQHALTILLRFLTFPTAETLRFTGPGIPANLELMRAHPWLGATAPLALGFSVFLVWCGLRFYFNRGVIALVVRALRRNTQGFSTQERLDVLVWMLPWVYAASFALSVKGPSAHTFWILWPFSFYPLLRQWDLRSRWFVAYLACALVFSVGGSMVNPRQSKWISPLDPESRAPEAQVIRRLRWLKSSSF